jgi:hypothetical protein
MVVADKVAVEAAPGLLAVIMLLSSKPTLPKANPDGVWHVIGQCSLLWRHVCHAPPLPPTSNLGMVYTPATQSPLAGYVRHLTQDGPGIAAALAEGAG